MELIKKVMKDLDEYGLIKNEKIYLEKREQLYMLSLMINGKYRLIHADTNRENFIKFLDSFFI